MGLDDVEIAMRAGQFYSVTFTDFEAAQARTIGDFYRLVFSKLELNITPQPAKSLQDLQKSLI